MGVGGPVFEFSSGSLWAGREQFCVRYQVQSMQILFPCDHNCPNMVSVASCLVPRQCRVQRQRLGFASQRKRPGGLTLKAMSMCFRIPCAKKTFNLPTACVFGYSMLPQGNDSAGESPRINSSFFNAGGTALLQKVAPESWFQPMNAAISLDESLCQGALDDANSQPHERPRI